MSENIFLSIIMPALNEEMNILSAINNTLRTFDDFGIGAEIVVVNDGSADCTAALVEDLISKEGRRVRLVNHEFPRGYGASFWDGVDNAIGQVVCVLPGDNENDPGEILRYLKLLDDTDIVVPFAYNKHVRSFFRNALSCIYLNIINLTFGTHFNYTNGTALYRKSILKGLNRRSYGFFFQADILIRLVKRGYLFAEVPYRLGTRKASGSKAVTFSNFLHIVKDYIILAKDIYIGRERKLKQNKFTSDSVSMRRYMRGDLNE